jgi:hypothetical protein
MQEDFLTKVAPILVELTDLIIFLQYVRVK